MLHKKENQPPRLHKKVSRKYKIDAWLLYYAPYLIFITFVLVCIIFAILVMMFAPGNDSAVVYNWGLK
jgi:hypothetical protein